MLCLEKNTNQSVQIQRKILTFIRGNESSSRHSVFFIEATHNHTPSH